MMPHAPDAFYASDPVGVRGFRNMREEWIVRGPAIYVVANRQSCESIMANRFDETFSANQSFQPST